MQDTSKQDALERSIAALAEPLATPLGIEVVDVDVRGQKGRRLVRVTADALDLDADAGPDIDGLAHLSRKLGKVLDEHDPIAGGYTLEVTSPGADRPLRRPRDFARNVGREIRLVAHEDGPAIGVDAGVVVGVTETELTLENDGAEVVVLLTDVDHATVVLPW
jgi:ribosome maturation factor RimP